MTLLIDIGNTRIKWARFENGVLQPQSAAPHADWVVDTLVNTILRRGNSADRVLVSNGDSGRLLHFGLPDSRAPASLEIVWPSGKKQLIDDVAVGQIATIVEASGK